MIGAYLTSMFIITFILLAIVYKFRFHNKKHPNDIEFEKALKEFIKHNKAMKKGHKT